MAICSGATKLSIDGERRKKKVGVRAMKTPAMSAPGRAGRGAVDQKFVKYLSESSNFVKKMPTLFSFEILGNEMRDSQLCNVYSSGELFVSGLRLGNIDSQSRLRLVFCTLLCDRTHNGECRTTPKKCQFSFLRNRKQSGYFDLALFLEF